MTIRELELALPLDKICDYARTQPIRKLSVFGSFARGEQTDESDVDVLVEFEPERGVGIFDFVQVMLDLQDVIGRKVDLATPPMIGKYIHDSVYRDLVPVYEADE